MCEEEAEDGTEHTALGCSSNEWRLHMCTNAHKVWEFLVQVCFQSIVEFCEQMEVNTNCLKGILTTRIRATRQ